MTAENTFPSQRGVFEQSLAPPTGIPAEDRGQEVAVKRKQRQAGSSLRKLVVFLLLLLQPRRGPARGSVQPRPPGAADGVELRGLLRGEGRGGGAASPTASLPPQTGASCCLLLNPPSPA